MLCNYCDGSTKVLNSRTLDKPGTGNKGLWKAVSACGMENIVWRVRVCLSCNIREETIEMSSPVLIDLIKRDVLLRGRHEF